MTISEPLDVEYVAIDGVIPYARNPRVYGDAIDKVAASIKEFGFRQPIMIDDANVIIAGHTRYAAAKKLGLETVPIHRASGLNETQIKAYRLADNRTHEASSWDEALLALELQELEEAGADLEMTAFDVSEIDHLLAESLGVSDDSEDALDECEAQITQRGDIWQMGKHRLVCGDATDPASYTALLGSGKADMLYTDPPYNVAYEGKAGSIANDDLSDDAFASLLQSTFNNAYDSLKAGAPAYVSYSDKETENFYAALRQAGFKQSSNLIWIKNQLVLGRNDYHSQHEPIWYGWKPGKKHIWHGGRKQTTLEKAGDILPLTRLDESSYMLQWSDLNIILRGEHITAEVLESALIHEDKPQSSDLHPTMKPVSLIERLIKNSSARNNIVLDCFGGSGTTLIACENLNRSARLIELDPHFCDVIIRRWQSLTGKQAIHAVTGRPFGVLDEPE